MKKYVEGLLFSKELDRVILIQKKKGPAAVVGRWNGVGGKIEEDETSASAMEREFLEEAGVKTKWNLFLLLEGDGWSVDFYSSFDDKAFYDAHTCEEEFVWPHIVKDLPNVVPNLKWIIPMALGHLNDNVLVYKVQEYLPA